MDNSSSYSMNGWLFQPDDPGTQKTASQYATSQSSLGGAALSGFFNKQDNIRHPSETPTFGDGIYDTGWPDASDGAAINPWNLNNYDVNPNPMTPGFMMTRFCIARHGVKDPSSSPTSVAASQRFPGGINLGLNDGHVEYARLDYLWSKYYWNTVNPPGQRPNGP
jgi:hypothetical protein